MFAIRRLFNCWKSKLAVIRTINCKKEIINYGKENIEIYFNDINYFYNTNIKHKNNEFNEKRENIILFLLHDNRKNHNYINNSDKWENIHSQLITILHSLNINKCKMITKKAGRRYNYDFLLVCDKDIEYKIEFKYNSSGIDKCPQFLSISSDKLQCNVNNKSYAEYFYDYYIQQLYDLYDNVSEIDKETYMRYIHGSNYTSHDFFNTMYTLENQCDIKKKKKKEIVDKSISLFLCNVFIDLSAVTKKLIETNNNKIYLLYKDSVFFHDKITIDELTVTRKLSIKNNNTIILETMKKTTQIHLLLRWKNRAGILYPAFQISIHRKKQ